MVTTEALPALRLKKVVVLGANGAMGAGSAALSAAGGCQGPEAGTAAEAGVSAGGVGSDIKRRLKLHQFY